MSGIYLIGGDFNCVSDSNVDRLPAEWGPQAKKVKVILGIMRELGLIDVWRLLHPKEKDFTCMSHVRGSYSRIDLFCTSRTDLHNVKDCQIDPITISDQAPVRLKFKLGQGKQFKYWRLNVPVINHCKAKEEIGEQLIEYFYINDIGLVIPSILWEGAKTVTIGKIIEITSRNKKKEII